MNRQLSIDPTLCAMVEGYVRELSRYEGRRPRHVWSGHGCAGHPRQLIPGNAGQNPVARRRQVDCFQAIAGEAGQVVVPVGSRHRHDVGKIIRRRIVRRHIRVLRGVPG